jgi:hypothetical protein
MPTKTPSDATFNIATVSEKTTRTMFLWLKGQKKELSVYRIPIKHLYFSIENGRYADKMIQLRADNPEADIDPRNAKWKDEIWKMLKGEYPGTEKDKEAFQTFKEDIKAREQLNPGVVLFDGGVLDGNRRFAALRELHETEKNSTRFDYFDGVILDADVGEEDRWRIEAGLQIGRDEKLDYSPINRLLKIKQGLELFKKGGKPEQAIARTLYGIPEDEIKKDIEKIRLIDAYLEFLKKPKQYQLVSGQIERFEEALNSVESAKKAKWPPEKVAALKMNLFGVIRFDAMTNWEMRDIWRAMGVPGKGKSGQFKNEKALNEFLDLGCAAKELQAALASGNQNSTVAHALQQRTQKFLDRMEAFKEVNQPVRLAERAQANLEELLKTLTNAAMVQHKEWEETMKPLPKALGLVVKLAKDCADRAKNLFKNNGKRKSATDV